MLVSEKPAVRVLLIDNATSRRDVMQTIINSPVVTGEVVGQAADADSAVAAVATCEPDVAVLEIQLPLEVGFELLDVLRTQLPTLPVIVCSFCHDPATRARAVEHGVQTYLDKPVSPMDLSEAIGRYATVNPPLPQEVSTDAR
jgi:DNA-binding NarL/FixJ family response regulator